MRHNLHNPHGPRDRAPVVKVRPPWLQALGGDGPPERIEIKGVAFDRADLFKHDSWAATALYRGPCDQECVVKFHRQSGLLGLPMSWFGRMMARHERSLLARLSDLAGVPRLTGTVSHDGKVLPYAVAREFIAGHPLGREERVDDGFFPALSDLLTTMHRRRVVYVDLHKRENIVVDVSGRPHLIDFQISLAWPRWLPAGFLFGVFERSDEYHLRKHWASCRPDQCGFSADDLRKHLPWYIRAHRLIARPFREARRRLLVRVGVRTGKGRVETEAFAEDALRVG